MLPSTCDCMRACERAHMLFPAGFRGETQYCFDTAGAAPRTFTELLAAPTVHYVWERPNLEGAHDVHGQNGPRAGTPYDVPPSERLQHPSGCSYNGWRKPVARGGSSCFCFGGVERGLWQPAGNCSERVHHTEEECLGAPCARCRHGFCQDPPRAAARRGRERPFVYVYPLPPAFNLWRPRVAAIRNTPYEFWSRLEASAHVTDEPGEADLFFLPVSPMGASTHTVLVEAVRYAAERWPFYNASGGADHLLVAPWDFGAAWIRFYPGLERVRFISHWGMTEKSKLYNADCAYCGPSYRPGVDVVAPSYLERSKMALPASGEPRTTLLFFSGQATSALRARLLAAHWLNQTGVSVTKASTGDLAAAMDAARFCLSLPGAGYGTRSVFALMRGCVPVLLGDGIEEPFSDMFDWTTFSLRVPEAQLDALLDIVRAVPAAREEELRQNGARLRGRFNWSAADQPDAFETVMEALRAKSRARGRAALQRRR